MSDTAKKNTGQNRRRQVEPEPQIHIDAQELAKLAPLKDELLDAIVADLADQILADQVPAPPSPLHESQASKPRKNRKVKNP